jgi:medium-chain acyl-[acyl-carrier-protein] hydrolase
MTSHFLILPFKGEIMSLQNIWQENFRVNWYDTDSNGQVKMSSIANYLQESAWRHARHMGFGFEDTQKRNEFWVIVALMVQMVDNPHWGKFITVETWPKGIERLFAFRDFRILSDDGTVIGAATSTWMILDQDTHRPKPVDIVKPMLHLAVRQDILETNPPHLQPFDNVTDSMNRQVQFSEVDFYKHVNNTRYIDWCLDAIPAEWHNKNSIRSMVINFLSEVRYAEHIRVESSQDDGAMRFQGIREEDGKVIYRAEFGI